MVSKAFFLLLPIFLVVMFATLDRLLDNVISPVFDPNEVKQVALNALESSSSIKNEKERVETMVKEIHSHYLNSSISSKISPEIEWVYYFG